MLNKIWPVFLIISFIYAIFSGRLPETNNSIFEYTASAVNLCLTLVGTMCLWCGIIKIAMKTSIINKLIKLFKPLLKNGNSFPNIIPNCEKSVIAKIAHVIGINIIIYKCIFQLLFCI